jgi:hypothetical protein
MARHAIEVGPAGRGVAANLLRLRTVRGLTCRQLSAKTVEAGRYIPASGITRMERSERRIDVDDLAALAVALDVPVGHLLSDPANLRVTVGVVEP